MMKLTTADVPAARDLPRRPAALGKGAVRSAPMILLLALAAGLGASGCAAPEQGKEIAVREEPEYVTGSNLPKRDRSRSGVKTVDPATVQQSPPSAPPSTMGGR